MYENYESVIKAKGLTNYKVSKDTGIAQSVLSTWKTKGTTPRSDKLQILAEYLGVSVDFLIGVPNTGPQNSPQWYINEEAAQIAQEIFEDPDKRALFNAARGSRPEDLRMAADMLERFKETNPDG
ncbi:MAG: helix-turn-helix transcriptional regulator [Oscillospiraceae bacterium]|nr:helix-turn-helix transcriptional regulator [Oscillospiraceae bacterium]MBO7726973.1 helix-turn-helix transcriptional regulator [Oscillospiraceae bacterium]